MKRELISLGPALEQIDRVFVRVNGRKLIYFGGCDYYRLASNQHVLRAAARRLTKAPLNVAASRVTTGNNSIYEQLEATLRVFFKAKDVVLAPSGYAANLIFAQALCGEFAQAVVDERAHPSLRDAVRFLDCPVTQYKHRDAKEAAKQIARTGGAKTIVMTDGVFAHDGSLAPLPKLLKALPQNGTLLVDDAHGAGVLGSNGRGTVEHFGIRDQRIVRTITLSKAFGAYGGAVLASRRVCKKIIARSALFAGSTPLPPPLAAAAFAAAATIAGDTAMRNRLRRNLKLIGKDTPIIAVTPKTAQEVDRLKKRLLKAGIFPSFIRYPSGPASGCFRFAISSEHTPEQIEKLLAVIRE
ncbi:MAG TPA: pyridoxal phosphate-dependent aminotransferase family protein [Candidatus Binatia bacterium]|nr:pyridoxal phosphate-dependent aminotransferase family protein [Candidatus Binatia bacterium]